MFESYGDRLSFGSPYYDGDTPVSIFFCKYESISSVLYSKEILKLIETVNHKYGNTIVMVTHNDAIKDMADRVVKLRDGMIRRNYQNEQKIPAADLEW